MPQDFEDMQNRMRDQMSAQVQDNDLKDSAEDLSQAAQNLNQTNMNQLQQTNALVQSIRQTQNQIQSLSSNVQALTNQQRMAAIQPPAPAPPPPSPAGPGMMSVAAGRVGGVAKRGAMAAGAATAMGGMAVFEASQVGALRRVEQVRQNAAQYQMQAQAGVRARQGGVLDVPNRGIMRSALDATGATWNPRMGQNYTFGAYSHAQSRNVGLGVQDAFQGAVGAGLRSLSAEVPGSLIGGWGGAAIGGAIGGLAGPLGFMAGGAVGSMLGGNVGAQAGSVLDFANPATFTANQVLRSQAFGATANQGANQFLRGGGGSRRSGEFSISQQADVGARLADQSLDDFTFTSGQRQKFQEMFNDAGLNLGVQDPQQYARNFEKRMEDARQIMKVFNTSMEEAVQFMSEEFSTMGFNMGPELTRFRTQMLAGAHTAGLDPMQMAQVAAAGARGAPQYGLMATAGARSAVSARGLAGVSATMGGRGGVGVGTDLLATVGGEEGLSKLLHQQRMQFMGGTGGTLMALGGGHFGKDVMGRLGDISGNLTGGRLMEYQANRHRELTKMAKNPELVQAQQFQMLQGLAEQMGGAPGTQEEKMSALAQNMFGMSPAQAEAFMKSSKALPEQVRRNMRSQQQTQREYTEDVMAEQFGIQGRAERWFRDTMRGTGATGLAGDIVRTGGRIGERATNLTRRARDRFYGIEGRRSYGMKSFEDVREMKPEDFRVDDRGEDAVRSHEMARGARSMFTYGGEGADLLKEELKNADPSTEEGRDRIRRVVGMVKAGETPETKRDIRIRGFRHREDVSKQDIMDVMRGAKLGRGKISDVGKGFDIDMESDIRSGKYFTGLGRNLLGKSERKSLEAMEEKVTPGVVGGGAQAIFTLGAAAAPVMPPVALGLSAAGAYIHQNRDAAADVVRGAMGDIGEDEWMYMLDHPQAKGVLQAVEELFKSYQPGKKQSPKVRRLRRKAEGMLRAIDDDRAKNSVLKILRKRGVEIQGDRILLEGAAKQLASEQGMSENFRAGNFDFNKKHGLFGEGVLDKVFEQAEGALKVSRQQDSLRTGLEGATGLDYSEDFQVTSHDIQTDLSMMDDEKIKEMWKSGDKFKMMVAHTASRAKQDKTISDEAMQKTKLALTQMGAGKSEYISGSENIDPSTVGAQAAQDLAKSGQMLRETSQILDTIQQRMDK